MHQTNEEYVVDTKGKKKAVIFPLEQYEELMEDIHDLVVVAERRNEQPMSMDEMKRRLRKRGLL